MKTQSTDLRDGAWNRAATRGRRSAPPAGAAGRGAALALTIAGAGAAARAALGARAGAATGWAASQAGKAAYSYDQTILEIGGRAWVISWRSCGHL